MRASSPKNLKKERFSILSPVSIDKHSSTLEGKKETQNWKSKQQGVLLSEILMLQIDWHTTVGPTATTKYHYIVDS